MVDAIAGATADADDPVIRDGDLETAAIQQSTQADGTHRSTSRSGTLRCVSTLVGQAPPRANGVRSPHTSAMRSAPFIESTALPRRRGG